MKKGRRKLRSYSSEVKEKVLKDCDKYGLNEGARLHQIPVSTVSGWKQQIKRQKAEQAGDNGIRKSGYRKYTQEYRLKIVKEIEKTGFRQVIQKYALPESTVYKWCIKYKNENGTGKDGNKITAVEFRKKTAKRYTPSQIAEIIEYASQKGVVAASGKFGASRCAIYKWLDRVKKASEGKCESPVNGESKEEIEKQRDLEILNEWHRHPGLGPSQIRNQLRRKGIKTSVNTIRRVMEDAGYRPPKIKSESHDKKFEAERPNHMWHLDFLCRHVNKSVTFSLIILDDCSRYVTGYSVDDAERADTVITAFEEATNKHGRPEYVMTDKGSAFWSYKGISRFTKLLEEMGIDQIVAEHKEWNGKIEVFNANLQKEFFNQYRFYDVSEMRSKLKTHLDWYNHRRTHHALGGLLVPADRYYGRHEEVMALIESGASKEQISDGFELNHRSLEMFKVISIKGKPEVYLMGQKIL